MIDKLNQNEKLKSKPLLPVVFLANYFPYDVKIKQRPFSEIEILKTKHLKDSFSKDVILILKPLSDLIDNILDDSNDDNYQLSCELADLLNTTDSTYFVKALIQNTYYAIDHRLWTDIETWLNKNHFDWKYNLIKNGLAVSIHDVV